MSWLIYFVGIIFGVIGGLWIIQAEKVNKVTLSYFLLWLIFTLIPFINVMLWVIMLLILFAEWCKKQPDIVLWRRK